MGDENGDGAAYLAALKQSTKPQAAPAKPALATTTPAATQRRPSGAPASAATGSGHREKRQSPRYRCQGSVRLREIAGVAATWATVTDISMQGCYVEASASHRAGASLVLAIEISGFRVETTGEVRAAYPGLGMGISFVKMAEADRERLRQVISFQPPRSSSARELPPRRYPPRHPMRHLLSPTPLSPTPARLCRQ